MWLTLEGLRRSVIVSSQDRLLLAAAKVASPVALILAGSRCGHLNGP